MLVVVDTSAQTATFTLNAVGDVFGAAADSLTNVVFEGIVTREDFTANRNDNPSGALEIIPPRRFERRSDLLGQPADSGWVGRKH